MPQLVVVRVEQRLVRNQHGIVLVVEALDLLLQALYLLHLRGEIRHLRRPYSLVELPSGDAVLFVDSSESLQRNLVPELEVEL